MVRKFKEQESTLSHLNKVKKGIEIEFKAFKAEMYDKETLIGQMKEQMALAAKSQRNKGEKDKRNAEIE